MPTLIIDSVRSFFGRHEIELRPLTILTGENSSGKTTLLSILSVVSDGETFPFSPAFNRAPYNLGNYDTIASTRKGRGGRARHFTLGYRSVSENGSHSIHAEATYKNDEGIAKLTRLDYSNSGTATRMTITDSGDATGPSVIDFWKDEKRYSIPYVAPDRTTSLNHSRLREAILSSLIRVSARNFKQDLELFQAVAEISSELSRLRTTSVAPIRSEPERTYSVVSEGHDPNGKHIPFILERLFQDQKRSGVSKVLLQVV